MDLDITFSSDSPLYLQLIHYFQQRIYNGELTPGTSLPAERKLAQMLQVNRSTVGRAYAELEASGLIERRKGSGTIISQSLWEQSLPRTPNWRQYVDGGAFLPNLPLLRRVREAIRQGEQVIDFASGELSTDLFPSQQIRDVLATDNFEEYLGYEHPKGNEQLRETLVQHLQLFHGIETSKSSLLITSGAQQALFLITQCLLRPGDAIAVEDPSYYFSMPLFRSAGLRLFPLVSDEHGVVPESIVELYRKHRIRMVLMNPWIQNPTGSIMGMDRKEQVLRISTELGIPIVEDDPFRLLSFTEQQITPLKAHDKNGNVLYIGSLSKLVASGMRIGWLVGPQAVIDRLADARMQMDFGLSVFPQWLANRLLLSEHFSVHLERLRVALQERRDTMVAALQEHLGNKVEFSIPPGGMHLWCRLKRPLSEQRLLEECIACGVAVTPGSVLGSQEGYLRLTYARPAHEQISEGIVRLAKAIEQAER